MNLLKWIVPLVPLGIFALLFSLVAKRSGGRENRWKTLRFPFLAFFYLIAGLCLFPLLDDVADWVMGWGVLQSILSALSPGGMLSYIFLVYGIFVVNACLILAFWILKLVFSLGLKKVLAPPMEGVTGFKKLWWTMVGYFYDLDGPGVTLNRPWVQVSVSLKWAMRILYLGYGILAVLLQAPIYMGDALISYPTLETLVVVLFVYPALSLLFVNEFRYFLDGAQEAEQGGSKRFDSSELRRVRNYASLIEQYKFQFPERFAGYVPGKALGQEETFYNKTSAESPLINAMEETLRNRGFGLNPDYISCMEGIDEGRDVLVDASLFSDFGSYLLLYLNARLARGENILFLAPDGAAADNAKAYLEEEFKKVNLYHPVWTMVGEEELHATADADILILTPGVVTDNNAFVGQEAFLRRLSTLVVLSAAEVAARDGVLLASLCHRLHRGAGSLQTIALSESIPPETTNTLRQILDPDGELILFSGNRTFENTHFLLWNYEPAPGPGGKITLAQDNLFGESGIQTYLGVALPLASVALRYGVGRIGLVPHRDTPAEAMLQGMKSQMSRLAPWFMGQVTQKTLVDQICLNRVDGDGCAAFLLVEDSLCNLPLAMYNYARYAGRESSMIHIVSKPYMLRDYFAANAQRYTTGEEAINMITPALADTGKSIAMKLLFEAREGGVAVDELLERVRVIDPGVGSVDDALRLLRDMVMPGKRGTPLEYDFAFGKKSRLDTELVDYKTEEYVTLKVDTPLENLVAVMREAKLVVRGKTTGLGIPARRMYHYFVPSQSFCHRGSLYKVTDMDPALGVVYATESGDRLDAPVDYKQSRIYTLESVPQMEGFYPVHYEVSGGISGGYEATLYEQVKIAVDTVGYFAMNPADPTPDLVKGADVKPLSEGARRDAFRRMQEGRMLSLRIKGIANDRMALLMAVMLEEMMKTVFPYSYKTLAVCPVIRDLSVYDGSFGRRLRDYFPRLNRGEFYDGIEEDTEILIVEDSESETGMLSTLLQNEQYPFGMLFDTMRSYLRWLADYTPAGNIAGDYLCFGGENFPEVFDREALLAVLSEFERVIRTDAVEVDRVADGGVCSYCGRPLYAAEYTEIEDHAGSGNRKICRECEALRVSDEARLVELYELVRKDLVERYGITLAGDIHVRFATAEKIRARMQTGMERVVLGFAASDSRELWVEADAPVPNVMGVLAHELTHIWQFDSIICSDLTYMEGHASLVEVDFLRCQGFRRFAQTQHREMESRDDVYGEGYRALRREMGERGENNVFSYMLSLFGPNGDGPPPSPGDPPKPQPDPPEPPKPEPPKPEPPKPEPPKPEPPKPEPPKAEPGIQRTPGSCPRYACSLLGKTDRELYERVLKAAEDFSPEVEVKDLSVSTEAVFNAVEFVRMDHPELFWLSKNEYFTVTSNTETDLSLKLTMSYNMTMEKARAREEEIRRAIAPFLAAVTPDMGDFDAVESIYNTIINLVDYDSVALLESKKQPKTNKPDDLRSIYGVFVKRKAVCAGYAMALQYLLNMLGMECIYIRGDTPRGYHAWNILKLEGDYYAMDITWGDGSDTDKTQSREGVGYNYFCVTDEIMKADHTPDVPFPLPACTATRCNWHRHYNLWLKDYTRKQVEEAAVRELKRGQSVISLRFETKQEADRAVADLVENKNAHSLLTGAAEKAKVRLDLGYKWSRNDRANTVTFYVTRL